MMLFALLLAAQSQPYSESRIILGTGTSSCGSFTATKDNPLARAAFTNWLYGLLTGYDLTNPNGVADLMAHTDNAGAMAWMDNYCAAHPLMPFATGAVELLQTLSRIERSLK